MGNEKSFRRLLFESAGWVLFLLFVGTLGLVLFTTNAGSVPFRYAVLPSLGAIAAILLLVVVPCLEAKTVISMRLLKRELSQYHQCCDEYHGKWQRAESFIGMFVKEDDVFSVLMAMQSEHRRKCQEYERLLTSLTGPVNRLLDAIAKNSRLESAQGDIRYAEDRIRRAHEAAVSRGFKVPELKTYLPGA